MRPSSQSSPDARYKRTFLLNEAVELLLRELSAIANHKWEDLPALKKKKVLLACRLGGIDWTPDPARQEPADWVLLKARISDLEDQSRRQIQRHLELMGKQVFALQELHLYWLECLNVSLQKFPESAPS
jgi:hypothetical protein